MRSALLGDNVTLSYIEFNRGGRLSVVDQTIFADGGNMRICKRGVVMVKINVLGICRLAIANTQLSLILRTVCHTLQARGRRCRDGLLQFDQHMRGRIIRYLADV